MRSLFLPLSAAFLTAGALVALVSASPAAADAPWGVTVSPVTSPAGANSSSPQLTVDADRAILSWMERADGVPTLKFADQSAAGWSTPRTVTSGKAMIINVADVPSVRAFAGNSLVAHWTEGNGPDPEASTLKLSWSKDGGATWSPGASPHHDNTQTQHGFASLFQMPGAGLGLVWLDGRLTAAEGPNASDNMTLRASTYDAAGKQLREVAIDTRVCDCCPTAVATTADGPIVAYRDRSAKEVRDIAVTRLAAGRWTAPVTVHRDNWMIEACPVNGPAISARGRDVVVAWFTGLNDEGRTWAAFSKDAGKTFGAPVRVDDVMSAGHVGVELLKDGGAVVSWVEFANDQSQFKIRRIGTDGSRSAAVQVAGTAEARVGGVPRIASAKDELLLAWTETAAGASRVRTARAPLPGAAK
jgi:hypothetical protein